ncbi:hypothetical protein H8E06_00620 [bacterium]|nr:hypothetical protein [bacterium]
MPSFVHTIPLYGRNLRVKCKELDFISYKNLTKTIYNNQPEDINTYIDQILENLVVNVSVSDLDIIDKFIILGHVRDVAISGEFALTSKCSETGKDFTINVDLPSLVDAVNKIDLQKSYEVSASGVTVNFQLPKSFNALELSDTVSACLHSVTSKTGTEIEIPDYADRSKLLDKLPVKTLSEFERFLKQQSKELSSVPLFTYKSPYTDAAEMHQYSFSFFDDSILELLKLLFQEDLLQMYEFEYDIYNICRLPYGFVKDSSFSELQVMYNIEARRRAEAENPQAAAAAAKPPQNYEQ